MGGAPPEVVDAYKTRDTVEDFEVWPENWEPLSIFLAASTQWRIIPTARGCLYQGLEYTSLAAIIDLYNVAREDRCKLFSDIRCIEQGALSKINER